MAMDDFDDIERVGLRALEELRAGYRGPDDPLELRAAVFKLLVAMQQQADG